MSHLSKDLQNPLIWPQAPVGLLGRSGENPYHRRTKAPFPKPFVAPLGTSESFGNVFEILRSKTYKYVALKSRLIEWIILKSNSHFTAKTCTFLPNYFREECTKVGLREIKTDFRWFWRKTWKVSLFSTSSRKRADFLNRGKEIWICEGKSEGAKICSGRK